MVNRAEVIDRNFVNLCKQLAEAGADQSAASRQSVQSLDAPLTDDPALTGRVLLEIFESQIVSRHLDIIARELRKVDKGYYTIGSSGHEGNAVIGRLTRHTDPAFLHYRSGGFVVERSRQLPGQDPIRDVLLGMMAAAADPIAGGRHKVWGSVPLWILPQTSTIGSHPPKAVGAAIALARARKLSGTQLASNRGTASRGTSFQPVRGTGFQPVMRSPGFQPGSDPDSQPVDANDSNSQEARVENPSYARRVGNPSHEMASHEMASHEMLSHVQPSHELPADAIMVCTFGDASVNHSVTQGAFNSAGWSAFQKIPVPLLFVCEDNSIGISVRTPPGWVEASMSRRPGIQYFACNGLDLVDTYTVAKQAVEFVRTRRAPAFLHMKVVRLLGHAGSDVETEYRTIPDIEAWEAQDPLLAAAQFFISHGLMTANEVLDLYESVRARVKAGVAKVGDPPKLKTAEEVIRPLAPFHPQQVHAEATRAAKREDRIALWGSEKNLPENGPARHMAVNINRGLHDLLAKYPEMLVFGEDVAAKGGVYHVTTGLMAKFGAARVFNTLLDETTILGLAIGAGHMGLLPVPEIQYLAYLHNAIDQLRGEACSTQFFSNGQYRNPMVVRINSLGYQKGFGGHFHNDNSIAAIRDIPGLIIACPSRGDDAVKMMRTCMALAKIDGRVVAFLEPIAMFMTKDLHAPNDAGWSFAYPPPEQAIALGEGHVYHEDGEDVTILTFGNGVPMSLRAAKTLREKHKVKARVVDLRWLNPLNEKLILEQAAATDLTVVVDEGRASGGVGEGIMTLLFERSPTPIYATRVVGRDTYIPLGPAANEVLPCEADIVKSVLSAHAHNHGVTIAEKIG